MVVRLLLLNPELGTELSRHGADIPSLCSHATRQRQLQRLIKAVELCLH